MKKITALLVLLAGFIVYGQGMKFEENTFKNILAKAKKENKLIFMDAYTTWCGPCKLMAKNIFPKQNVGDFYNANFINTKFDMEKGEGLEIAKKYGVKAYPTYLFINGDGEMIYRGTGYYEENEFISIGKEATDPSKQLSVLKKKFEAGETNPEFLQNFMKVFAYSETDLARKAAERYFAAKKGQELSQNDLGLLYSLIPDSKSPLFTVFTDHKADMLKMVPETAYNQMIRQYQLNSVMSVSYNKETKKFDEQKFVAEASKLMSPEEAKALMAKTKMSLAFKDKKYPEYQKLALQYYGDGSSEKFTSEELNTVAWNFFEKIEDKNSLKKALTWAQQSVKKKESYANDDTLANLYYKVGDKANAKLWAQKSIDLAKKSGEDYASTQELLNKIK